MNVQIRASRTDDWPALRTLYPRAFPQEDLTGLVHALLDLPDKVLSLVAEVNGKLVGHIAYTYARPKGASLLGPLCVHPEYHRRGIAAALVAEGHKRLAQSGQSCVCVLGDPAYYGRFGFTAPAAMKAPYPLPDEWQGAWQSLNLANDNPMEPATLDLPEPWMVPALWRP